MRDAVESHPLWKHVGFRPTGRHVRAALLFLPNFVLAKGAIYLLPLAIAALAPAQVYGSIELAVSIGLLASTVTVGIPMGGMNQVYLVRGERRIVDQVAAIVLIGCSVASLLAVGAYLLDLDPTSVMVMASLGVAVVHQVGASASRMLSWRNLAAWTDGIAMLAAGALILVLIAFEGSPSLTGMTLGYLLLGALATIATAILLVAIRKPGLRERLRTCVKLGLPMTIFALLGIWLSVGGRILVGLFNATDLAAYSVAFRVAGITLGIHQLAATALFAKLYSARTREADKLLTLFFVAVGVATAAVAVAGRAVPELIGLSALDARGVAAYRAVLPLAGIHTFYWIGFGMVQLRINRYGLAQRTILPTLLISVAGIALICGVAMFYSTDIVLLSWLIAFYAAAFFFANTLVLARRGLPHRRLTNTGIFGGLLLLALALVLG